MANRDQSHEPEGNGGTFMLGLLAGTVLGAGLGILLAPKAGSELRDELAEQARKLGKLADEQARNFGKIADEQARQFGDKAAEQVRNVTDGIRKKMA